MNNEVLNQESWLRALDYIFIGLVIIGIVSIILSVIMLIIVVIEIKHLKKNERKGVNKKLQKV
jgi:hypothetical protein